MIPILTVSLIFSPLDALDNDEEEVCVCLDGEECLLSFLREEDFLVGIFFCNYSSVKFLFNYSFISNLYKFFFFLL